MAEDEREYQINHAECCRREGNCIKCFRPICAGCNSFDKEGVYGLCMICGDRDCEGKLSTYTLSVKLPDIPERFLKTCNPERG